MNWGSAGAVTEFDGEGEVLFHAFLDSGELWRNGDVQNYRGFRFNWTGIPNEEPAIAAFERGKTISIYVSWNGDIETKVWRIFGVDGNGREVLLGEEERENFETSFYVRRNGDWDGFLAEAVGGKGQVLRRSRVVKAEDYVSRYSPGKSELVSVNGIQIVLEKGGDEL